MTGIGTGVLSGMFGLGGAILSTPAIRLLGASPVIAIGTTLPSIIPSAASGTVNYFRSNLVDMRVALISGAAGAGFAVLGAALTPVIPGDGHLQQVATAVLLCFTALRLLRVRSPAPLAQPPEARPAEETTPMPPEAGGVPAPDPERHPASLIALTGAVAGLVAGMLGVGGGIVMVPAFTEVLHMEIKRAVATSLVVVGVLAVPGTITHAVLGNIDWRFALWLTLGVVPGARVGSRITIGAREHTVRVLFGSLLVLLGVIYGISELVSLIAA